MYNKQRDNTSMYCPRLCMYLSKVFGPHHKVKESAVRPLFVHRTGARNICVWFADVTRASGVNMAHNVTRKIRVRCAYIYDVRLRRVHVSFFYFGNRVCEPCRSEMRRHEGAHIGFSSWTGPPYLEGGRGPRPPPGKKSPPKMFAHFFRKGQIFHHHPD
jgi:hypothetical protein